MLGWFRKHWHHRREGGWTISQLLVAMAVSGVSVGAAFAMLTLGQRHSQRGDTVTALQQHTRNLIEWMVRDLRESAPESVFIAGEGNSAIAFASARDASGNFVQDSDGSPKWQRAIVYYLKPNTTELYRYVVSKDDWSQRLNPASILQQGLGERISKDVSELSFTRNGSLVTIALATTQKTEAGATTKNRLTTRVLMRNRL